MEAAEEGQQLPDDGVQQNELPVVERVVLAGHVDADVFGPGRELVRNPLADDEAPPAEPLALELQEDVPLVGADDRVGGQKRNDEAVLPDGGHRPVTKAEERIGERRHAAAVGFEHLEGRLVCGPEAAAATQVHRGGIASPRQRGDVVGAPVEQRAGGARESRRALERALARVGQRPRGQNEIGEAAGHDQALIVRLGGQHHRCDARGRAKAPRQRAFPVAGDQQLRGAFVAEEALDDGRALGTVAGAGQGDNKKPARRGEGRAGVRENRSGRKRARHDAE